MRILIFLCALYLLILPCIPCSDNKECSDLNGTEVSSIANNHDNHEHENEDCNPFCSCSCCGQIIFSTFQLAIYDANKPTQNVELKFFYKKRYFSTAYFGNIWQPPKV